MKKSIWITMMFVLALGVSLACAEEAKEGMKEGHHKMGMMGMHHDMMSNMMKPTVTATADGGVVVVFGNKLTKYDKNMNIVKEVELKMDKEGMEKCMHEMKEMCPIAGKKSGEHMDMDDDDDDDDAPAAAPEAAQPAVQK